MPDVPAARTPGATYAAPGEYLFHLGAVAEIMGGPAYSTAHGPRVEGERMMIGLMRMRTGTGAEPHSHPNEQWIYMLEGPFRATAGGTPVEAGPGASLHSIKT